MFIRHLSGLCAIIFLLHGFASPRAQAQQNFGCQAISPPFCQYTGLVTKVYVNRANLVLAYFEQPIDISLAASVGISGITNGTAVSLDRGAHPEFAELYYSTLLTAHSTGKTVTIQMREGAFGYLQADRIWLNE